MSAQRKLIRHAVSEILKGRTLAGERVFPSRTAPLWPKYELPAIMVYCGTEGIEVWQESPREYLRTLELRIECVAELSGDADDIIDDLGDTVERTIGRSDRLFYAKEHLVSDIVMTGQQIEFRDDGAAKVAALIMTYQATYRTREPDEYDPEPLDDLERVDTRYSLNNAQAEPEQAEDMVEGLQR